MGRFHSDLVQRTIAETRAVAGVLVAGYVLIYIYKYIK